MSNRTPAAVLAACLALGAAPSVAAQDAGDKPRADMSKVLGDVLHERLPGDNANLSKSEVSLGLKEALTLATDTVAKRLGAKDGYFGDGAIRIPLPGALGEAQKRLKPFG